MGQRSLSFFPSSFVLFSCDLMTNFSAVFGFLFLFCVSIVDFQYMVTMKFFFFFPLKIFWCGPILKSLLNFVTTLLLFYILVFWPQGIWDLSSLTRDRTCTPCIGRRSLNHWTAREVPTMRFWYSSLCINKIVLSCWCFNFKFIFSILYLYSLLLVIAGFDVIFVCGWFSTSVLPVLGYLFPSLGLGSFLP